MTLRIAHISDVHIRNLKYHYEYKNVFEQLYKKIRELQPDIIINTGDTAHTKTQLSPEWFSLCADFFLQLSDIAPHHVILGNHDGNLKNRNREDAISPIAKLLRHPNFHFHKNSTVWREDKHNVAFHVLSIFDKGNWSAPIEGCTNIALYHGAVKGVVTDVGWTISKGDLELNDLKSFDYGLLGDIHKSNQKIDKFGRFRYAGSLVQQNFGETNDKGFLIWDIHDNVNFDVKHHKLNNPQPFITIDLTKDGNLPVGYKIPPNAKLRLRSTSNLSLPMFKSIIEEARLRYNPTYVTYQNSTTDMNNVLSGTNNFELEDLRDAIVQEKLIREYLKPYKLDEETLKRVVQLNHKYPNPAQDVSRNLRWRVKKLEWDNLFNYGKGNYIDFDNLEGVVGIFGKNFSGKSSIIDSMLFTLYNSVAKNVRKNLNIINQNEGKGRGRLTIEVNGQDYIIERKSSKYEKKLRGVITEEAKTDVDFKVESTNGEDSLNGTTRNDTDKKIREYFGNLDDFLMTSMSSQFNALNYVQEGSSKRKEILAKFLDLEIFDRKFKYAKDEAAEFKGRLKKLENNDVDLEIKEASLLLRSKEKSLSKKEKELSASKQLCLRKKKKVDDLQRLVNSMPTQLLDIEKIRKELKQSFKLFDNAEQENDLIEEELKDKKVLMQQSSGMLLAFDIKDLQLQQKIFKDRFAEAQRLQKKLQTANAKIEVFKKKSVLLKTIPCNHQFPSCSFIKDAHQSWELLEETLKTTEKLQKEHDSVVENTDKEEYKTLEECIEEFNKLQAQHNKYKINISKLELKFERNKSKIRDLSDKIEKLEKQEDDYFENKTKIIELTGLKKDLKAAKAEYTLENKKSDKINNEMLSLTRNCGSLSEKLKQLSKSKEEMLALREEYVAYDYYLKSMHPNGIAFNIVKNMLQVINEEIAKCLANICDFDIYFEAEGNKLEIFIKHLKYEPRPIELASGAEKTIAAIAIRLALLTISNLPKSNIFILDEPATALDEENMEGFTRILEMIKDKYEIVFIISHLDSLKDTADMTIDIQRDNKGYAHVECG